MDDENRPGSGLSILLRGLAGIALVLSLGGLVALLVGMLAPVPEATTALMSIQVAMEDASPGVVLLLFGAAGAGLLAALLLFLWGMGLRGTAPTRMHAAGALAALVLAGGAFVGCWPSGPCRRYGTPTPRRTTTRR